MKAIKMFCVEFFNKCIIPLVLVIGSFLFAIMISSALLAVIGLM